MPPNISSCHPPWTVWQQRRHIAKAAQIGQNFVEVFGAGSFLTKIRPIWADVWSFPNHNMSATLECKRTGLRL